MGSQRHHPIGSIVGAPFRAALPDCDALIKQIQKGVSYQVLYQEQEGISVGYWSLCHVLSRHVKATKALPTTLRLKHVPGGKAFVDCIDGIDI